MRQVLVGSSTATGVERARDRGFAFWVCYVLQLFFLTALLLPENLGQHENNREYFLSRRAWFFGFLALFYVIDLAESRLKGVAYIQSLGPMYPVRTVLYVAGCLLAIWTRNAVFHGAFAIWAVAYQLVWFARMSAAGH